MNSGVTHSILKNIIHESLKYNQLSITILIAADFDMSVCEFHDCHLFLEENLNL